MKTICSDPKSSNFKKPIIYVFLFSLIFLLIACSSTKTIEKTPPFRFAGTTTAKGVDDSGNLGVPLEVTQRFSAADKEIYAHLAFEQVEKMRSREARLSSKLLHLEVFEKSLLHDSQ